MIGLRRVTRGVLSRALVNDLSVPGRFRKHRHPLKLMKTTHLEVTALSLVSREVGSDRR